MCMMLEALGQQIWENWQNGTGPCEGCPNRDTDGYWKPSNMDAGIYSGASDPEIVFVGDASSDTHPEDDPFGVEGKPIRRRKDFGEPRDRHEIHSEESASWKTVNEWIKKERVPGWFFEEIGYSFTESGGAYFTNAKKCADIYPKGEHKDENRCARKKCATYLPHQLKLLEPEIVVPLSTHATKRVFDIYDIEWPGLLKHAATKVYDCQDPVVIPSYHWSGQYIASNATNVPGIESTDEYWQLLADSINSV